jgi:RNA polymerase sigma-70 factor (ECF subfamily)
MSRISSRTCFLTAWNRLASLREPSAFGGWLAMIARNRAVDFHRQRRTPSSCRPISRRMMRRRSGRRERMLDDRPNAPRRVSRDPILRLVEGMTGPEIAERTGLTPASVRVNLHRGMKMLREQLER